MNKAGLCLHVVLMLMVVFGGEGGKRATEENI